MTGLNWPWWFRSIDRTLTALLTIVALCVAVPFYRRLDRIRHDLDEDRFTRDGKPQRLDEMNPAPLSTGWSENDYAVIDGETRVGRIHGELIHGRLEWLWFLQIGAVPPPTQGMAATLEEAKADFERRYAEVMGGT